jgi:hypothetical protein
MDGLDDVLVSSHHRQATLRIALLDRPGGSRVFSWYHGKLTFARKAAPTAHEQHAMIAFSTLQISDNAQYILGSWYGKDEIAKRSVIFHVSSSLATMFSGYLMTAV